MRWIKLTIVLLFVIILLIFSTSTGSAEIDGFHSSALEAVTFTEGNIERTSYYLNGNLTDAADKHYATKVVTRDGNTVLEQYFDTDGNPAKQNNGHYALLREFNNDGREYRITYLDGDGKPMIIIAGYAILLRSYNSSGQVEYDHYLDKNGELTKSSNGAYGQYNEYENGLNTVITYLGEDDKPTKVNSGYAMRKKTFYEDVQNAGRVENDFYYDEMENPISLSIGQFGVHYEYDELGRKVGMTYLDASGSPITTFLGYTTVKRTFYPDNTVDTEMYYDESGNQVSLSHGQYGIKHVNGKIVYLDKNGKEFFDLNNWLHNNLLGVVIIGIFVGGASLLLGRKGNIVLLLLYLIFIFYMTLMYRIQGEARAELELFWSYKQFFSSPSLRLEILNNIWLFIPLGAILCRLWPRAWVFLIIIMLSIAIEVTQYLTGSGLTELDDIISNSLGGFAGYGITMIGSLVMKSKMVPRE
jgi:hypothetical protein